MAKDTEIEIQVQVEKVAELINFLQKSAKLIGEFHQIDEYFTPAHRNFIQTRPTDEWLRLRDADGKYSINYKNWHHDEDGKTNHCDEYETKVDDISSLQKLFSALNMQSLTIVDKRRQLWVYKDYEIAVDSVKDLGDFVEIEYKGDLADHTPKQITEQMIEFLKDLGCEKISRNYQGYPFLLLFPEEAKYEEQ